MELFRQAGGAFSRHTPIAGFKITTNNLGRVSSNEAAIRNIFVYDRTGGDDAMITNFDTW